MKVFTPPIIAKTLALTSFASLSVMVAAPAQAITFSGDTTGAPTWNRPNENGSNPPAELSDTVTAVPYQVQNFFVDTTGAYNFLSTSTAFDNYTFLYQNSFSAASPLTNVIIGNDDNPNIFNSGFNGVNLTAGTQYYFVNTGYSDNHFGAYDSSITGVGNVTLAAVPWETDALPVVGSTVLFGAGMWAKRKFAQKKIGIENA
ncbi:hypothetical protein [Dolichospermum flos-aquae]|uniref:PEP-CTERM sorting domain-containing protein n=1 Tax=Dolichospermum flos-aquae CCAP 1403/13F TaxID=315271 RepID=A0A6H2BZJ9_DOLFA|nr:hypothetical protein [Dolichospermum flos-aquae]QJB44480.1 hypothetical protein HGD76_10130 [Dolichospermum flos-aquae CCAP 1403/13F]